MPTAREQLFTFHGAQLVARADGALCWPAHRLLIVADLHLGRGARMARRGGALLPPYGDADTLAKLEQALADTGAEKVISLGDSFDDDIAAMELSDMSRAHLHAMAKGRDWVWISGNHDPAPQGPGLPGQVRPAMSMDGIALRHIATQGPDISGHYHPGLRLGRRRYPAFLIGQDHLILPAFGAYTGMLAGTDPALRALVPRGHAVLTGASALMVPLG